LEFLIKNIFESEKNNTRKELADSHEKLALSFHTMNVKELTMICRFVFLTLLIRVLLTKLAGHLPGVKVCPLSFTKICCLQHRPWQLKIDHFWKCDLCIIQVEIASMALIQYDWCPYQRK
jgi:hypothetical protein